MNPHAAALDAARVRHASRAVHHRRDRSWTAMDVLRQELDAAETYDEDWPPRLLDDGDEFAPPPVDFAWPLILATQPAQTAIGPGQPEADANLEPAVEADDPALEPLPVRDIEDILAILHGRTPNSMPWFEPANPRRAASRLGRHPYFQAPIQVGFETPAHELLALILACEPLWLRPVLTWVPPKGDALVGVRDLFAHLLFRFPVAPWFDLSTDPAEWPLN